MRIGNKLNLTFVCIFVPALALMLVMMYRSVLDGFVGERKSMIYSETISAENVYRTLRSSAESEERAREIFFDYVNSYDYSETGYFYVYDMNGVLLAHRYLRPLGQDLWDLQDTHGSYLIREHVRTVNENEEGGFISFWFTKSADDPMEYEKVSYTKKISDDMLIGTGLYYDDLEEKAMALVVQCGIFGFIIMLIFLGLCLIVVRIITRPIRQMEDSFSHIEEGNLVHEITISSHDEIGKLGHSFRAFVLQLSDTLRTIRTTARELVNFSEVLTVSSESISEKCREGSRNIGVISRSAEDFAASLDGTLTSSIGKQNEAIGSTTAAVEQLSSGVATIISTVEDVSDRVVSYKQSVENSRQNINRSFEKQTMMYENIHSVAEKIKIVGEKSLNIDDMLVGIEEFAEKANILSINAAIEASHAGEAGKSFSIVAGEVKRLADNIADSVGRITQIVQDIKSSIQDAVSITEQGERLSSESRGVSEEAAESLEVIIQGTNEINGMVTHIADITGEQNTATERVLKDVQELKQGSRMMEETFGEQTNTANMIKESVNSTTRTSDNIAGSASELSKLAFKLNGSSEKLMQIIEKFEFGEGSDPEGALENAENGKDSSEPHLEAV